MHTKFLSSVVVLGVISSQAHVMSQQIFGRGLKVNAESYVKTLAIDETLNGMDAVADGEPYVFEQGSTPTHKAHTTQT